MIPVLRPVVRRPVSRPGEGSRRPRDQTHRSHPPPITIPIRNHRGGRAVLLTPGTDRGAIQLLGISGCPRSCGIDGCRDGTERFHRSLGFGDLSRRLFNLLSVKQQNTVGRLFGQVGDDPLPIPVQDALAVVVAGEGLDAQLVH